MNAIVNEETKTVRREYGLTSTVFSLLAGIIAIGAGIYLANLSAASGSSLISDGENGVGWYCIAKGLFMMASPYQLDSAKKYLAQFLPGYTK